MNDSLIMNVTLGAHLHIYNARLLERLDSHCTRVMISIRLFNVTDSGILLFGNLFCCVGFFHRHMQ